ncbi:MAG: hypothetical protein V4515_14965 [Chloroflexota bacterium]
MHRTGRLQPILASLKALPTVPRRVFAPRSRVLARAVPPITFPTTPLKVKVEVALAADLTAAPATWGWADATNIIYTRDAINITRGRADEGSVADTSKLSATADNRGGHWSTRNPMSPWFGKIRKGTPIRVSAEGYPRYTGFLSSLPPRWDVSGNDRYAPLEAQGLLYRLTQGETPKLSPLRRTINAISPTPVNYWPLEDGPDASAGASALPGGVSTGQLSDGALFAQSIAIGASGSVDLSGGGTFTVPTGQSVEAAPNGYEFDFVAGFDILPTVPLNGFLMVAHAQSSGQAAYQAVGVTNIAGTILWASAQIDTAGTGSSSSLNVEVEEGVAYHFMCRGWQDVLGLRLRVDIDGLVGFDEGFAGTLMMPDQIVVNGTQGNGVSSGPANVASFGHLAFWAPYRTTDTSYLAVDGYDGEQAHLRFLRLCDEENVPATCGAPDSQLMGPQAVEAFIPLIRACEETDSGYLYEGLDFGLVLQGHVERENQFAALALDYTATGHVAPPLEPTDDDKDARNDVEVKRDGGSSARLTEESLTEELSIPNIGRRDESVTFSLADDDQTLQIAGWRLHRGTFPGYRYPRLSLNLAAAPSLIDAVCRANLAFRTTIDHPPTDIVADDVTVIVEGYTETLGPFDWDIEANCSPQGPWRVSVMAADLGDTSANLGWLDWDSCVLHADVTAVTGTDTWLIDAVPVDSTTADDFPRDVYVGGEKVTVTACSGSSAPQTWTVTRSVNGIVKAHSAGDVIKLARPFILAL